MNNIPADKFNYLVLILALSLVISVFSKFSDALGIRSALFFLLGATFFFHFNACFIKFRYYVIPLLFFVLAAVLSYYGAEFRYNARSGIMLLSYCSAAYLLSGFLKPYDKRSVLIIPVFIGLWLTIFLFASNTAFSDYAANEVLSKNMRAAAGFLILALSLSFVFWQKERKIYMYTSFIILAAVLLTKVYFAAGLAFVLFGTFLFLTREKIKVKTYISVLPFTALSAAAFARAFTSGWFSHKTQIWKTALSVIKDNLVTGTGFCNYSSVSGAYAETAGIDVSGADNMILQVLAETGIAGFILFSAVLAVFFTLIAKKLKKKENKELYLPVLLAVVFFMLYNMFESAAFIPANMLVFFILLSVPSDVSDIKSRPRKINAYAAVLVTVPLLYVLALPLMAAEDYKKGIMFFAAGKYDLSRDYYLGAMERDFLNPEYASRLSDAYFAISRKENSLVNLDKALEYKKLASSLNRFNGKYYYDLAWLYKMKNEKRLASDNITKALEMEPFNEKFLEAYGELIY